MNIMNIYEYHINHCNSVCRICINLRTLQPRYCKVNFGGNIVRIVTFVATVVTLFCLLHSQHCQMQQHNIKQSSRLMQNVSVPVLWSRSSAIFCLSFLDGWPFTWLWPRVLDDIYCSENEDLTVASHMFAYMMMSSEIQMRGSIYCYYVDMSRDHGTRSASASLAFFICRRGAHPR